MASSLIVTLDHIDWSALWLAPWRAVGEPLAVCALQGWGAAHFAPCPPPALRAPPLPAQNALPASLVAGCSNAEALNAASALTGCPAAPVRFVPQSELPAGEAYEAFIFRTGCVPTREGLHDFFNGLCWMRYPKTKLRLNQLQAAQIARLGVAPERGPARDALTLFDENVALLQAPDALWDALAEKDWASVFGSLRPLWQVSTLTLFGHALTEKLVFPRKSITAHVYRVPQYLDTVAAVDDWLAQDLSEEKLASKPFVHLPVLGVPGWWAANEALDFYADTSVFRALRTAPAPGH